MLLLTNLLISFSLKLGWDTNSDATVTGYKLYYGAYPLTYTNVINAGTNLEAIVPNVRHAQKYYFAVTAYNARDLESDFSLELRYTVPFDIQLIKSSQGPLTVFTLKSSVFKGMNYSIEASRDLKTWSVVSTGTTTTEEISVPFNPTEPNLFFRVLKVENQMNRALALLRTLIPRSIDIKPLSYRRPNWMEIIRFKLRYHPGHHFDPSERFEKRRKFQSDIVPLPPLP